MTPRRLSTRLGLSVGALSAFVVIAMVILAWFEISHQLDLRARESLAEKLQQIQHTLQETAATKADIVLHSHNLRDQVAGHDYVALMIDETATDGKRLLSVGSTAGQALPLAELNSDQSYHSLVSPEGYEMLVVSKEVNLRGGQSVKVFLVLERKDDALLVNAYLKSALLVLPLILIMVGGFGWWLVRRGLKPLMAFREVSQSVSARELSLRMQTQGLPEELEGLAQAINVMLDRLDAEVSQMAHFCDDLAHELRTPINNLMGKAQVTLSRERSPESYKQALESCTEELERLSQMVSQMLFLASVSQPSSLQLTTIRLHEEAGRIAEMFLHVAEDKSVSLTLHGEAEVQGDRLMVQRAISNLLSNAIRHSPHGEVVSIDITQDAEATRLAVANKGAGIEAEHIPHIFKRFYRVHSSRSRKQGGTGLGLAIVRSIMNLHGGEVSACSAPGVCTTFTLQFRANTR
ncbi:MULTISPECIES: heavy metal sensor histidine kinase [Pseudomonas]|uniref:heavy metal sensor histidine kinase n=1 Tax=Pseudomonas TaxID=286 RepID=UPI0005900D24|nr:MULTISPECIES: heavy metal sensor histidine kinase [Pseudomonas]MBA1245851.1 heavy metal sensor histidine kinase [Pseudomonas japonica]